MLFFGEIKSTTDIVFCVSQTLSSPSQFSSIPFPHISVALGEIELLKSLQSVSFVELKLY